MPLLDQSGLIADPWISGDNVGVAGLTHSLVTFEELPQALAVRTVVLQLTGQQLGVLLENSIDAAVLLPSLAQLRLIVIGFPAFSDGRGFSLARRIRAMGFKGTLRAKGPLIVDQFHYALACGFDQIDLPDASLTRQPVQQWLTAIKEKPLQYQQGYQRSSTILEARRLARTAARSGASHV
jgi:uncharacterized protein (DUF934 family)